MALLEVSLLYCAVGQGLHVRMTESRISCEQVCVILQAFPSHDFNPRLLVR